MEPSSSSPSLKGYAEYGALLDKLDQKLLSKEDVYQDLMQKEQNTLQILDRLAEHTQRETLSKRLWTQVSLPELLHLFASTWKAILHDMVTIKPKSFVSWMSLWIGGDRKIVMGMTCICISLFIFFIQISSGT